MATSSSAESRPSGLAAVPRRRLLVAGAGALAVLAVALLALFALRSGGDDTASRFRPADRAFSVVLPDGWRAAGARELRTVPSAPVAVLRRADRRGLVVIRRRPALARNTRSLTRDLTAALGRRFKGLRPVGARTVKLASGNAYVYTFARPSAGTVQSLAVAPRRGGTYTIDAVASAGARDAAADIGAIVRSFDTPDPVPTS